MTTDHARLERVRELGRVRSRRFYRRHKDEVKLQRIRRALEKNSSEGLPNGSGDMQSIDMHDGGEP